MADETTQQEINRYWSELGLNPELFPVYYPIGPRNFLDGAGQPTGVAGSELTLTRDLNNFPHMFMGLRVTSVYDLPPGTPAANDVALYNACKEHVDGEQTLKMEISQQSVFVEPVMQKQICGGYDGIYWHPFPIPFPMAGGNTISIVIRRATSYPTYSTAVPIIPRVYVTIYAATARADFRTIAPHRVYGGAAR